MDKRGLFNDLITAILDVFRKSNIYGPKGEKSELPKYEVCKYIEMILRYVEMIYLYIYTYIYIYIIYTIIDLLSCCPSVLCNIYM